MPSKSGSIRVPFCPESRLSGVRKRIEADDIMLYGTKFEVPEEWDGRRLIVHFGAVDQTAKIYVDGKYAGSHEGGYLPFSIDITDLISPSESVTAVYLTESGGAAPMRLSRAYRGVFFHPPSRKTDSGRISGCRNHSSGNHGGDPSGREGEHGRQKVKRAG